MLKRHIRLNLTKRCLIGILCIFSLPCWAHKPSTAPNQTSLKNAALKQQDLDTLFKRTKKSFNSQRLLKGDNLTNALKGLNTLKKYQYPLVPYLESKYLQKTFSLDNQGAIDRFHAVYPETLSSYLLQLNWQYFLAKQQDWKAFVANLTAKKPLLTRHKALPTKLKCLEVRALASTGNSALAIDQALTLWLTPKSLPNSCDWVIQYLKSQSLLTQKRIFDRFKGSVNTKNYRLARYLKKSLTGNWRTSAKWYYRRMRSPSLLAKHPPPKQLHDAQMLLTNILNKLVWTHPEKAEALWIKYDKRFKFSLANRANWAKQAAIKYSISLKKEAQEWLNIALAHHRTDTELLNWRMRYALGTGNWPLVLTTFEQLPPQEKMSPAWRYWKARALAQTHIDPAAARAILIGLSAQRDFYGFLAAETLGIALPMNASSQGLTIVNPEKSHHVVFNIVNTWIRLGKPWRARKELWFLWDNFSLHQKKAAVHKSHQWGWHDYAIRGLADIQEWDILEYRFPNVFVQEFNKHSKHQGIEPYWPMAIARQESAFNPSAKSWVGATGLMQLMPRTAQSVAKKLGLKHKNWRLVDPKYNILLGTNYLSQMTRRFKGNSIYATAAYNAGPHRVEFWNKRMARNTDMDIWIEVIPIKETRDYVKRVLTYSAIYAHLNKQDNPKILGKWLPSIWKHMKKTHIPLTKPISPNANES